MLNIAICDDDPSICKQIYSLCNTYLKDNNYDFCIDCFSNGDELLNASTDFSIIFLDIEMPNKNGISTAQEIRKHNKSCKIIFVTNHNEYMKQSYLVRAFAYIEKPVSKNELYITLQEAIEYYHVNINPINYKFKTTSGVCNIDLNNIIYIEYHNRKINIVTKNQIMYMYSTITKLSSELKQYNFLSPHNAYLVNSKYILSITKNNVILQNNIKIPLSQRKSKIFKKEFINYISNTNFKCLDESL